MSDGDDLFAELQRAAIEHDDALRARWARSLPLPDLVSDRWERAQRLGFAEDVSIYGSAYVYGSVEVGAHTWIGPNVLLDGSGGHLAIGAWCSISAGVQVYTHDTVHWALSGGVAPPRRAPVTIGSRCYLGSQSIVTLGVTIGDQVVVAANSVVNRDVPPRTIVGGSPARPLGEVREVDGELVLDFGDDAR